jgi:hypothetical protein
MKHKKPNVRYAQRLREFINRSIKEYFGDGPSNLNEVLNDAGIPNRYTKFFNYKKPETDIKSPLSFETLEEMSLIDPDERSPLQIRAYLMGEEIPEYGDMSREELIDSLIEKDSRIAKLRAKK